MLEVFCISTRDLYFAVYLFNRMEPTLDDIKAFLEHYLKGKGNSMKVQAKVALWHWENFTGQKPTKAGHSDVDRFVHRKRHAPKEKDRLEKGTLSVYLLHIAKFYEWLGRGKPDPKFAVLAECMMDKSRELKPEETAEHVNHRDVLKMLMRVEELQGKLLVRLLVFSEIPIGCLEELKVRHIYDRKNYDMYCERAGKRISGTFYSDTSEIISRYIEEKNLNENDEIIGIKQRQIQYLITDCAKRVGIKKKVTPKDLRKFGKDPIKRKWLIEEYEKMKKLKNSED